MIVKRKKSIYELYIKRFIDIICSVVVMICFFGVYIIIAILVRIKLGSPVIFKQPRPGIIIDGKEKIFYMYKFRTMTDERGNDGELLPDNTRLTKFGKKLRETSLDELPELFNILKGDMSIVGPRPQLVRDMVFMDDDMRMRHTARPGLTGLAQVKGRNAISWEEKIKWDLKYIENVSILEDIKILFETFKIVFTREGITDGENVTAVDYGDYLLKENRIRKDEYDKLQAEAQKLIKEYEVER